MINLFLDSQKRAAVFFYTSLVVFIISVFMIAGGFNRYSINGIKKDNGRVEITFSDNFLYMFPYNSKTVAPVTNIRLVTKMEKDSTETSQIVFFTTTYDHRIKYEDTGITYEDMKPLNEQLNDFLENRELRDFGDSFYFMKFYGLLGLILLVGSAYFATANFRNVPPIKIPWKKIGSGSVDISKKIAKAAQKVKEKSKEKSEAKELQDTRERLLRVIIPAFDANIVIKPDIFKTPDTQKTALICESRQIKDLQSRFGNEVEYITANGIKTSGEIISAASAWLQGFNGYVMIQTGIMPELSAAQIGSMYASHKDNYSECTILTSVTEDEVIPYGKIIRNVANRVVKISESKERKDDNEQSSEVYEELLCLSTKKILQMAEKLEPGTELARIVEAYSKSKSNITTFQAVSGSPAAKTPVTRTAARTASPESEVRNTAAVILSSVSFSPARLKNLYDTVRSAGIKKACIVVDSSNLDICRELLGEEIEYIATENSLGDGDDAFKSAGSLLGFKGNIAVITEECPEIKDIELKKFISVHEDEDNACSYKVSAGRNILYCVRSEYYSYSVKKISRNDDTKKYQLSDIIDILRNDRKRVGEINGEV